MPTTNPDPGSFKFRKGTDFVPANYYIAGITAPGSGDDEGDGFSPGSIWWAVASDYDYRQYLCVDATLGSARWIVVGVTVSPSTPGSNEDYTQGFRVGSFWSDPSSGRVYQCADDTPSAAIWNSV